MSSSTLMTMPARGTAGVSVVERLIAGVWCVFGAVTLFFYASRRKRFRGVAKEL
jgi:hypothetical protein